MRNKTLLIATAILSFLIIGFISAKDPFFQIKKNFTLFSEVINEVNNLYVVPVEPERVIRTGISAMLESLDPYTVLIDEADTQEIDIMTTGRYAGIGLEAGARNGQLVVIAPLDGYPAARAGIRAGDVIVSVNNISADELTPEDLNNNLRGEPGSKVLLVVERIGIDEPMEFELVRERIEVKNVPFYGFANEEKTVGYIILSRFSQGAAAEVREAIDELQQDNELEGLILDLRNNPGGLLAEGVKVVDLFIPADLEVVSTRGQHRQSRQVFRTEQPAVLANQPVIVLQNYGSASSSEIVSGALQDHDRAIVMGSQSFGKGLVQIIRPLSYSTALKITTSNYYIPSGRSIQSVDYGTQANDENGDVEEFFTKNGRLVYQSTGISPDIELDTSRQSVLEAALTRHNTYFFFASEYVSEHELPEWDEDELFDEFLAYLDESGFTYESRSERALRQFKEQVTDELDNDETVSTHIESIKSHLESARVKAFDESRNTILRELNLELTSRYDGNEGRQRMNVVVDPLIKMALEISLNPDEYSRILQP